MPTTPVVVRFPNAITSAARFSATLYAVPALGGAPSAKAIEFDVCDPCEDVPWHGFLLIV